MQPETYLIKKFRFFTGCLEQWGDPGATLITPPPAQLPVLPRRRGQALLLGRSFQEAFQRKWERQRAGTRKFPSLGR